MDVEPAVFIKFGGAKRRRFYAIWENVRWGDGRTTPGRARANEGL